MPALPRSRRSLSKTLPVRRECGERASREAIRMIARVSKEPKTEVCEETLVHRQRPGTARFGFAHTTVRSTPSPDVCLERTITNTALRFYTAATLRTSLYERGTPYPHVVGAPPHPLRVRREVARKLSSSPQQPPAQTKEPFSCTDRLSRWWARSRNMEMRQLSCVQRHDYYPSRIFKLPWSGGSCSASGSRKPAWNDQMWRSARPLSSRGCRAS